MRLTRSGAALQSRRARAPDDLRHWDPAAHAANQTRLVPRSESGMSAGKQGPPPFFLDNLHFGHFVKSVNLKSRLNYLTKSSKWRLSEKKGASAGISARRLHFPGSGSRTAREGNDNHGEAEAQAPGDSEDRRLGAAARRPRVRT